MITRGGKQCCDRRCIGAAWYRVVLMCCITCYVYAGACKGGMTGVAYCHCHCINLLMYCLTDWPMTQHTQKCICSQALSI